jgi:hypothetical protein
MESNSDSTISLNSEQIETIGEALHLLLAFTSCRAIKFNWTELYERDQLETIYKALHILDGTEYKESGYFEDEEDGE